MLAVLARPVERDAPKAAGKNRTDWRGGYFPRAINHSTTFLFLITLPNIPEIEGVFAVYIFR